MLIPLESVKLYNGCLRRSNKEVRYVSKYVQSGKNITIVFSGTLEARKFTAEIVNAVTVHDAWQRAWSNMIKDAFALVDDTLGLDTRGYIQGRA